MFREKAQGALGTVRVSVFFKDTEKLAGCKTFHNGLGMEGMSGHWLFFSLPTVMIITEYFMQSASPISTPHILDQMYVVVL